MPNVENIRLWVHALESFQYEQGRGVLHQTREDTEDTPDKWCCLGVACDVARRNGLELPSYISESTGCENFGAGEEEAILPVEVQEWLGLPSNPSLAKTSAAIWNDEYEASFRTIARLIRNEYLGETTDA